MDYKHRFAFSTLDKSTAFALGSLGLAYKIDSGCDIGVIEILESDDRWPQLRDFLKNIGETTQVTPIFTKAEIAQAEWFTIRSKWRWEYPQPDTGNFGYANGITYAHGCPECGANAVQVGNFRVRKSPKWNAKAFLMLNWVDDVLFVSENTKNILKVSGLGGFKFAEVLNTRGRTAVPNIYQLSVENCLPEGMVINANYISEEHKCPLCGTKKYIMTGRGCAYEMDAFNEVCEDIVMSSEVFGAGNLACRKLIISKKFYETIVSNGLGSQLDMQPVIFK